MPLLRRGVRNIIIGAPTKWSVEDMTAEEFAQSELGWERMQGLGLELVLGLGLGAWVACIGRRSCSPRDGASTHTHRHHADAASACSCPQMPLALLPCLALRPRRGRPCGAGCRSKCTTATTM